MEAFQITMDAIAQKIQSYNQNVSGGSVQDLGLNYTVKGIGMLETENDFNQLIKIKSNG